MKQILFLLLAIILAFKWYGSSDEVSLGPGVMAADPPQQTGYGRQVSFNFGDYRITEVAKFNIKAKVLAKKNYHTGREAELSPTDLALGWGRMSDEAVLENIEISQSGRFYRWKVESFPIPRREIETHSANMHLIPADDLIREDIELARKGDIIEITGTLVNVISGNGNWHWHSSLTRNDIGSGACELIFVKKFDIHTL